MEYLPDQGFDCTRCGRCCRGVWSIEVDPRARRAAAAAGRQDGLVRHGALWHTRIDDGRCTFLDARGLCSLHELGKPSGCSQFPFLVVRTPEGLKVGASFYCPAIAANVGPPMADSVPRLPAAQSVGHAPLDSGTGRSIAWTEYLQLEQQLYSDLEAADVALALFRRLEAFAAGGTRPVRRANMALRTYLVAVLLGSLESGQPSGAPELTRALLHGDHVSLPQFGWEGDPARLWSIVEGTGPAWLDAEIRRYLRALLFRKYPALDRPIASNLVLLCLLPWLCRWYTFAAAQGEPGRADWVRAVEWLELRLVTHVTGLEPLLKSLADAVLRQVDAVAAPAPAVRRPLRWAAAVAVGLLGSVVWQAFPRPSATVALVVEEPPRPEIRQALQSVGGHATFLLDLPHLHDVSTLQALTREGHDVGALGVPEAELAAIRQELEGKRIHLDPASPAELERKGYHVTTDPRTLHDGDILVVHPGDHLAEQLQELGHHGVRFVSLPELTGPH